MQPVDEADSRRNSKSQPHDPVFKEMKGVICHFQGKLDDWVSQAFTLGPLFPEKHTDTNHDKREEEDEPRPPENRSQPSLEDWPAIKGRISLIVSFQNSLILNRQPGRQLFPKQRLPIIFRRRQAKSMNDYTHQSLHNIVRT